MHQLEGVASQTLDILPAALEGVRFRPEDIRLDPAIRAAERANRLVVEEGVPFRDAYRRVAAELTARDVRRLRPDPGFGGARPGATGNGRARRQLRVRTRIVAVRRGLLAAVRGRPLTRRLARQSLSAESVRANRR